MKVHRRPLRGTRRTPICQLPAAAPNVSDSSVATAHSMEDRSWKLPAANRVLLRGQ